MYEFFTKNFESYIIENSKEHLIYLIPGEKLACQFDWYGQQRGEAFNMVIRENWNIFANYLGEENLLKMMNTIVGKAISKADKNNHFSMSQIKALEQLYTVNHDKYYSKYRRNYDQVASIGTRFREQIHWDTKDPLKKYHTK